MLDINLIREKPDLIRTALKNRQMDSSPVDAILSLDEKRRALLTEVEKLKSERNTVSKEISKMKDAAERETKIVHGCGRKTRLAQPRYSNSFLRLLARVLARGAARGPRTPISSDVFAGGLSNSPLTT